MSFLVPFLSTAVLTEVEILLISFTINFLPISLNIGMIDMLNIGHGERWSNLLKPLKYLIISFS